MVYNSFVLEKARKILTENTSEGERIAVSVSGGMDSMCLFFLVLECGAIDKKNLIVINFEHGIRGESSKKDSIFVKEQCEKAGVEFIGEVLDVPDLSKKSGKSIETTAREERRRLYEKLIKQKKVSKVLLAHHRDDQTETVLMHIFRGCGLNGLSGMKIYSGNILRPLLTTSRAEIEQYVKANNIPYVTDETNLDTDYNRNFLRNEIIPKLKTRWGSIDTAIANLADAASENERLLDSLLEEKYICKDELKSGTIGLSVECFGEDMPTSSYIFAALKYLGVTADIEHRHIKLISELSGARNGARINLTNDIIAAKEYGKISFYKEKSKVVSEQKFGYGEFDFCGKRLIVAPTEPKIIEGRLVFDFDKVPSGSVIRRRNDGDIFKAVNGGTKKLKEFFIDKKIPLRLRDEIPCLCYKNEVLLLFGIEISEKIKLDSSTKNAAKAEINTSEK